MNTTVTDNSSIPPGPSRTEWKYYVVLGLLIVALWVPRVHGPIDMRWDGGVYYVLGTSIAEGKGYRLLNEPGEIQAIQYPPLLPLIVAAHQKILGTSDPLVVGQWLRLFSFVIFFAYILSIFMVLKRHLSLNLAFIGTVFCLFHISTYFMSDLLFPEVLFGLATTSFVLLSPHTRKRSFVVATALLGIAAFGLRTIGVALLVAWMAESLLEKNFIRAAVRFAVALGPLLFWQAYIVSVVSGPEYNQPAYDYQRAGYLNYNVSYATNMFTFKDPVSPELGQASIRDIATRIIFNLGQITQSLGEAVSSKRIAYEIPWKVFDLPFPISTPWPVDVALFTLGGLVLAGIALQLIERQWLLPLYVLFSIISLCLTPWPDQFPRYLMPLMPFLVLSLLMALLAATRMLDKSGIGRSGGQKFMGLVIALILIQHALTVSGIYTRRHQNITYQNRMGETIQYKLFYYFDANRALDAGLDWLVDHAKPHEILAGSMPHWMYLRTGLKAVMAPLESDPLKAQTLLDSVPVTYLLIIEDKYDEGLAVDTKRYMVPVVQHFPERWQQIYTDSIAPEGGEGSHGKFLIYRRVKPTYFNTNASIGNM